MTGSYKYGHPTHPIPVYTGATVSTTALLVLILCFAHVSDAKPPTLAQMGTAGQMETAAQMDTATPVETAARIETVAHIETAAHIQTAAHMGTATLEQGVAVDQLPVQETINSTEDSFVYNMYATGQSTSDVDPKPFESITFAPPLLSQPHLPYYHDFCYVDRSVWNLPVGYTTPYGMHCLPYVCRYHPQNVLFYTDVRCFHM
jgi:hypothetical protein